MKHVPQWNTLDIAGYHFREAGATAVQELAFTIGDAIAYIEAAQSRGLDVDTFAPRLSYSLGCYMDLFEEVAKYRAARRLFSRMMKERFNAKNPKSYLFRIFSGSCGSTLVAQQPINNIVRVTMHALMGILGGHQAIHTACWDEGFALPPKIRLESPCERSRFWQMSAVYATPSIRLQAPIMLNPLPRKLRRAPMLT